MILKNQDVDLYTVRVEDLAFVSNFTLRVIRDDYIQALVSFFTVEFTKCLEVRIKI